MGRFVCKLCMLRRCINQRWVHRSAPILNAVCVWNRSYLSQHSERIRFNKNVPHDSYIIRFTSSAKKYRKVSPIEHVLLRPDSYVGSNALTDEQLVYLYDTERQKMKRSSVRYVPALLKIFDEILVNAADNRQRDPRMKHLSVSVDRETGIIAIYNDGEGIPIEVHPEEGVYVPTLIFGTLLTSSNYDDAESKIVGGRNGFGAKLCNIFSTEFVVETSSLQLKKRFKQVWKNNMSIETPPIIEDDPLAENFTRITFTPDLKKFHLTELDETIFELMRKRAIDIAGTLSDVKVLFNGQDVKVCGFESYVNLYTNVWKSEGEESNPKALYCYVNPRWKVAVAPSDSGFEHVSFVNNIATTKGGRHVDYIVDQIVSAVKAELVERNRSCRNVRPSIIKSRLFLFVNSFIENPSFESQTKEYLTTPPKNFGSRCILPELFVAQIVKETNIVDLILKDLNKQDSKIIRSTTLLASTIPKLEDAEYAGTGNSPLCTLIITEGDSAKALAVAGLAVLGRSYYGVFPVRGKLLNVRGLSAEAAVENHEIAALMRIIGLKFGEDYESDEARRKLRYGHVMVMTDQDPDGSHIKGLLINFLHFFWPSLLKAEYVQCFLTPLLKARYGSEVLSFYNLEEFEKWKESCPHSKKYTIKYYKGLGTSTAKEAREYFSNIERHRVQFVYRGAEDNESIDLFFNRTRSDDRKNWINKSFMEKKQVIGADSKYTEISSFVNNELIIFSQLDLERSIPSAIDGLKPSQRKVLHTMFQRFNRNEIRVSQLAGAVAQYSLYHHGEDSLVETIIRLGQNFVGSNNINLLEPIGQFGTRMLGGADAANARYIYTSLSSVARAIFPSADDGILTYREEENSRVEPVWYCPVVPLILINGAGGIGTGWATKILPRRPSEVIRNVRRAIEGLPLIKMLPFFRDFKGTITELDENHYQISGLASALPLSRSNSAVLEIEIRELPVGVWTQNYKKRVLEMLSKTGLLLSFNEMHTENAVCFVLKVPSKKFRTTSLKRRLKLVENVSCASMVAFDEKNVLHSFTHIEEIFEVFFETRKKLYEKRKKHQIDSMESKVIYIENQLRFIENVIKGDLKIERKSKREIIEALTSRGFKPDPSRKNNYGDLTTVSDFGYLLNIPLIRLCDEEVATLAQKYKVAQEDLEVLRQASWKELWLKDLDTLSAVLDPKVK